ncbi:hypothetical protein ACFVHB_24240 [Kitasatospora sp. NPDC127111]|uniref:hypothetical protein n=1 Tax=Kitasatospora sp. NPDC127111 TaxID=3345363 RepID=UPI0036315962
MNRPPRMLLVAASAASVAAGSALATLVAYPLRRHDAGAASLLFLLVLCAGTLLVNSAIGRVLQCRWQRSARRPRTPPTEVEASGLPG